MEEGQLFVLVPSVESTSVQMSSAALFSVYDYVINSLHFSISMINNFIFTIISIACSIFSIYIISRCGPL